MANDGKTSKKKNHTQAEREQIIREAMAADSQADVARKHGVLTRTLYAWIGRAKRSGKLEKILAGGRDTAPTPSDYAARGTAPATLTNPLRQYSAAEDREGKDYVRRLEELNSRLYEQIGRMVFERERDKIKK